MRPYRRELQVVFQDPYSSLNPRLSVGDIVGEPLRNYGVARGSELKERVAAHPRQGRAARRGDANATRTSSPAASASASASPARWRVNPSLIVCDEPVSALDVSVQAQVVNLLQDLQRELRPLLSLRRARPRGRRAYQPPHRRHVSRQDRRARPTSDALFRAPLHPYTEALLSAVPLPDPDAQRKRIILKGDVPSPINPPAGCRFHTRCPYAEARCRVEEPAMREVNPGHLVACHLRG